MRRFGAALLALLGAAGVHGAPASDEQWISLFNGRDLDGWTVKITGYEAGENFAGTFRVVDGLLRSTCEDYPSFDGRFGHLFYKESFSHYRIRLEYRFIGEQCPGGPVWGWRNSGLMIHGQPVETMERDQDFPVSIELQLLGSDATARRPTANVCTPGTNVVIDGRLETSHCIESTAPSFDGEQWVTVEVEVRGGEVIRHIVDGVVVLEYEKPQLDNSTLLTGGTLSLQAESHPVEFRSVELLRLR